MKVGDLVSVKKWCKGSGRLAVIIKTLAYETCLCKIIYLDNGEEVFAQFTNLEVISECG